MFLCQAVTPPFDLVFWKGVLEVISGNPQGDGVRPIAEFPVGRYHSDPSEFPRSNHISHQGLPPLFGLAVGGGHPWQYNGASSEISRSDDNTATPGDFLGQMLFLHRGLPLRLTWFFGGGHAMDFQGGRSDPLRNSPVDQYCTHPRGFTRSNPVSHQGSTPPLDLGVFEVTPGNPREMEYGPYGNPPVGRYHSDPSGFPRFNPVPLQGPGPPCDLVFWRGHP
jgi:hypothetical protein